MFQIQRRFTDSNLLMLEKDLQVKQNCEAKFPNQKQRGRFRK